MNKYINLKTIIIISGIITIIKIVISCLFDINVPLVEDYKIAVNMINGLGYVLHPLAGPTAIKTPIYPIFLYIILAVSGAKSIFIFQIIQHLIHFFFPIITYKILIQYIKNKYAFISAVFWLVHPSYQYYSFAVEATNLFLLLILLSIFFASKIYLNGWNRVNSIGIGILSGLTILTQAISAPIFSVYFIYLIFKKRSKYLILSILMILAIVFPWIIRNYVAFDRFIPGKSPLYMNLFVGFSFESHGKQEFDIIPNAITNRMDSLREIKNDVDMEQEYKSFIVPFIMNNLSLYIEKTIHQSYVYWTYPPRYFNDNSIKFLFIRKIPVIISNLILLISLIILFKYNRKMFVGLLLVLIYFTIVYSLTLTANIRFKLDIEWIAFFAISIALSIKKSNLKELST